MIFCIPFLYVLWRLMVFAPVSLKFFGLWMLHPFPEVFRWVMIVWWDQIRLLISQSVLHLFHAFSLPLIFPLPHFYVIVGFEIGRGETMGSLKRSNETQVPTKDWWMRFIFKVNLLRLIRKVLYNLFYYIPHTWRAISKHVKLIFVINKSAVTKIK